MKLTLAYVANNKSFIFGETWSVIDRGSEVQEDGWYICKIIKTANEHTEKPFEVLAPLKQIENPDQVKSILDLHYGSASSILTLLEYSLLLTDSILEDERYVAWVNLIRLGVNKADVKDKGMLTFISKVTDRLKFGLMSALLQ